MKKSLLALAVLGAFAGAASAQSNVTIYGVADAAITHRDNGAANDDKTWGLDSGQQSGSRIGFKGVEDLGSGLSAIFALESGFNIDNGQLAQGTPTTTRLFGRQAWVGLNSGFGVLKLGRQYNPIRTALESVDPFALGLAGSSKNVFKVYDERADNTLNYATPTFGGFSGQLAYSFGEVPGSFSTGRQLGLSAGYATGPINVVVAYHQQKLVTGTSTPNGDEKTTLLGGTYDFGVAKAYAAYAWNKGDAASGANSVDSRDALIGVSAPLGDAGTIMASYIRRDDKFVGNRDSNQWALGYSHSVSKRTNLYASYARVKNDGAANLGNNSLATGVTAGNDPSLFNVGIRHKF